MIARVATWDAVKFFHFYFSLVSTEEVEKKQSTEETISRLSSLSSFSFSKRSPTKYLRPDARATALELPPVEVLGALAASGP